MKRTLVSVAAAAAAVVTLSAGQAAGSGEHHFVGDTSSASGPCAGCWRR